MLPTATQLVATQESPDAAWRRFGLVLDRYDVALFVGAGLTIPNRLPNWRKLTSQLAGYDSAHADELSTNNIGLTTQLQLARERSKSPTEWVEAVRIALYRDFRVQVAHASEDIAGLAVSDFGNGTDVSRRRVRDFFALTNPVLLRLVQLCATWRSGEFRANSQMGAILTTNLDGLLQLCDRAIHGSPRILRTVERAHKEPHSQKISVYHVHGYLQLAPKVAEASDSFVLTEDEYLARNDNPYSWASVVLHWALREFPLVFIGCSMTDELVRRALRRSVRERVMHFQAERGDSPVKEHQWRRQFAITELHKDAAINDAVNLSLAFLGVWPLWVANFEGDLLRRLSELGLS